LTVSLDHVHVQAVVVRVASGFCLQKPSQPFVHREAQADAAPAQPDLLPVLEACVPVAFFLSSDRLRLEPEAQVHLDPVGKLHHRGAVAPVGWQQAYQ